jgi:hypothetical protein
MSDYDPICDQPWLDDHPALKKLCKAGNNKYYDMILTGWRPGEGIPAERSLRARLLDGEDVMPEFWALVEAKLEKNRTLDEAKKLFEICTSGCNRYDTLLCSTNKHCDGSIIYILRLAKRSCPKGHWQCSNELCSE